VTKLYISIYKVNNGYSNEYHRWGEENNTLQLHFQDYFGGVTVMNTSVYKLINGYSNQYRGWGGEDDDVLIRLR
jgi:predicted glycosyltransferase involved in capsule biosynthesis